MATATLSFSTSPARNSVFMNKATINYSCSGISSSASSYYDDFVVYYSTQSGALTDFTQVNLGDGNTYIEAVGGYYIYLKGSATGVSWNFTTGGSSIGTASGSSGSITLTGLSSGTGYTITGTASGGGSQYYEYHRWCYLLYR